MKVSNFSPKLLVTAMLLAGTTIGQTQLTSHAYAQSPGAAQSASYTVKLAQNLNRSTAESLKKELEAEGYTPVQIIGQEDSLSVLVGAAAGQEQAQMLLNDLKQSAYTPIEIVPPGQAQTAPPSAPVPTASASAPSVSFFRVLVAQFDNASQAQDAGKTLTQEGFPLVDIEEHNGSHRVLLGRFQNEREASSLIEDLKNAGFSLSSVIKSEEFAPASSSGLPVLPGSAQSLSQQEQEQLKNVITVTERMERGEASADEIRLLTQQIKQLSNEMQSIVQQRETLRREERDNRQTIFQHYMEFDTAIAAKDFTKAQQSLDKVRQLDPNEPTLAVKSSFLAAQSGAPASGSDSENSGGNNLLYIGLGALALLGAGAYFATRKKSTAGSSDARIPTSGSGNPPSPSFEKSSPSPKPETQTEPVVSPSVFNDSLDQSVFAPNTPINLKSSEEEAAINSTAADIEALLKNSIASEQKNAPAGTFDDQVTIPLPDISPQADTEDESPIKGSQKSTLYEQNFDSYEIGTKPNEWRGEFDFATLTIQKDETSSVGTALKYVKPTAAGSASYHCFFPAAKGFIIAEFELKCEDKNKYLLGIYLEKDEDFRQSFHASIQRLDEKSPASIRIQGEAVPYEMGTWAKIRFELDLVEGKLSSFVNGELIAKDVEIPNAPDYINTISIRDNIATTGIISVTNIRVVGS